MAQWNSLAFSEYYRSLAPEPQARYKQKTLLLGFDPYALTKSAFDTPESDVSHWPAIEYPDICNYLVLQTSWATNQQMKAWKSTEAYSYFVSGWVADVLTKSVGEKILLFGKVNHSLRASETSTKPWVFAEKTGTIINAHCTCMSRQGEACSHIAALLYKVCTGYRMHNSSTCTGEKRKRVTPGYVKNIPCCPVKDVDFSSSKTKFTKVVEGVHDSDGPSRQRCIAAVKVKDCAPTSTERDAFYQLLANSGARPVALSLVAGLNDQFVPSP